MRPPKSPPLYTDTLLQLSEEQRFDIEFKVGTPLVDGKYLHWDTLRHKSPPQGLSTKEWWAGLKYLRNIQKIYTPLEDTKEFPFTYCPIDLLAKRSSEIDRHMGGMLLTPRDLTRKEMDRHFRANLINEAITSSQMEGASTTRQVAKEMILNNRPPRTKSETMIMNNYKTMLFIKEIKEENLTPNLILELHKIATTNTLDNQSEVGRFRNEYENITVIDNDTEEIVHTPPPAQTLVKRIEVLCEFANNTGESPYIHPSIRSIIIHFWLAYEHPFTDGNGRVARALFYWSMLHHDYWLTEFISISNFLKNAPSQYARSFLYTESDDNDLTYFIIHQFKTIEKAFNHLNEQINNNNKLTQQTNSQLPRILEYNSRQQKILQQVILKPNHTFTIKGHQTMNGIAYASARSDLLDLVEKGLFQQDKVGRAMRFYPVKNLKQLLS